MPVWMKKITEKGWSEKDVSEYFSQLKGSSQFHLNPCEGDGTANPGSHFQVH